MAENAPRKKLVAAALRCREGRLAISLAQLARLEGPIDSFGSPDKRAARLIDSTSTPPPQAHGEPGDNEPPRDARSTPSSSF
jgi:hypothetical protein